ncbi:MAG: hypothetical protein JWO42_2777 [Chloroflexi bacterium]|nr:hypothetical protein [Chloroflexota bacterium]
MGLKQAVALYREIGRAKDRQLAIPAVVAYALLEAANVNKRQAGVMLRLPLPAARAPVATGAKSLEGLRSPCPDAIPAQRESAT